MRLQSLSDVDGTDGGMRLRLIISLKRKETCPIKLRQCRSLMPVASKFNLLSIKYSATRFSRPSVLSGQILGLLLMLEIFIILADSLPYWSKGLHQDRLLVQQSLRAWKIAI